MCVWVHPPIMGLDFNYRKNYITLIDKPLFQKFNCSSRRSGGRISHQQQQLQQRQDTLSIENREFLKSLGFKILK